MREAHLQWLPELEIGWYPVSANLYGDAYWQEYRARDETPAGARLTAMRCAFVAKHWPGDVVDIGIGGGRFVRENPYASGYDINPRAVAWLKANGRWCDPYRSMVDAITCWDSLEHIHDPGPLLDRVQRWVFVSIPIFADCEDVLRSRHFKKDEHVWYFTRAGLARFMRRFGFALVANNGMEQLAGREQIESFAFERVGK